MKACAVALGLIILLVASCLPVPFDLALSQGAATASRMNRDNANLVTGGSSSGQGQGQGDPVFFPSVMPTGGFDYGAGFVTSTTGPAMDVQAVAGGSRYNQFRQDISNPDTRGSSFVAWPVKNGQSYLFAVIFDALNPATGDLYATLHGDPVARTLSPLPPPMGLLQTLDPLSTAVIGASIAAYPAATYDMLHLLAVDGAGNLREMSYWIESGGLFTPTPFRNLGGYFSPPFPLPAGLNRVFYFYDENSAGDPARIDNRSYACWYDTPGAVWKCYTWWETPTGSGAFSSKPVPIDHRIDVLLSTGQLLSTEGATGRVYDRDGNLLATFPLGNLSFIGEQYVGGVPRCYFSQCMIYDHTLHFNVYWIRSDELVTLGT